MPPSTTLERALRRAPEAQRRRAFGGRGWLLIALGLGSCTFPDYELGPESREPLGGAPGGGRAAGGGGGAGANGGSPSGANGGSSSGTLGSGGTLSGHGANGGQGGDDAPFAGQAGASDGPPGEGIAFTGTQLILFGQAPTDDLTIEMWINTTMTGDVGTWYEGAALFDADLSGSRNDFGASLVGSSFAFGTGSPDVTALSQTPVNTGRWVHVAGSREKASGIVRVLVNGQAESTLVSGNTNPLSDATPPSLGGHVENGGFYNGFTGIVDEVRLWNVVRTPQQIADNMHTRLIGNEPGLVGYWRFDDGSGLTATDSSPSQNNGVLGGGDSTHVPEWVSYPAPAQP